MTITRKEATTLSEISLERFHSKLLRATCRVRTVFKYKSLKGMLKEPTVGDVKEAELMWVKEMQRDMIDR